MQSGWLLFVKFMSSHTRKIFNKQSDPSLGSKHQNKGGLVKKLWNRRILDPEALEAEKQNPQWLKDAYSR
jgi:hypothetical protein